MTNRSLVLLLEDDAIVAEGLRADLEDRGFRVLGPAFDCSAALEVTLRERPDFAILDTHLGSETCEAVLDECIAQEIPVAITTGHQAHEVPGFATGFSLLPKPYLPEHLTALLDRMPFNQLPNR
jgi:DNA-binding response OmpR family regulator